MDECEWLIELTHQVWGTRRYVKDVRDCLGRRHAGHHHAGHHHELIVTTADEDDAYLFTRKDAEEIAILAGRIRYKARILGPQ